jgi:hypothetical protein
VGVDFDERDAVKVGQPELERLPKRHLQSHKTNIVQTQCPAGNEDGEPETEQIFFYARLLFHALCALPQVRKKLNEFGFSYHKYFCLVNSQRFISCSFCLFSVQELYETFCNRTFFA